MGPLNSASCSQQSTHRVTTAQHHRSNVTCHVSSHISMLATLQACDNTQHINKCSVVLEQLHRLHNVCCAGSRKASSSRLNRLAASANNSNLPSAAGQPQQLAVTTYTPDVQAAAPGIPATAHVDLLGKRALLAAGAPAGVLFTAVVNAGNAESGAQGTQQHSNATSSSVKNAALRPGHGSNSKHTSSGSSEARQLHDSPTRPLQRPAMMTGSNLRQMLQQQVQSAVSWHQLQQLLSGRRESLTLKHLGLMAVQVAHLKTQVQRQHLHELHRQYIYRQQPSSSWDSSPRVRYPDQSSRNSTGRGNSRRRLTEPPDDVLIEQLDSSAAAAGFEPFLQDLASAIHAVVQSDPGLADLLQAAASQQPLHAAASTAGPGSMQGQGRGADNTASTPLASSITSSTTSSRTGFSNPPDRLSGYLANALWGFAKLNHTPQEQEMLLWVEGFAAVCHAADAVSFSQVCWSLGQLQFWPGKDVLDALAIELARRMNAAAAPAAEPVVAVPSQHAGMNSSNTAAPQTVQASAAAAATQAPVTAQQLIGSRALSNILWAFAVLQYTPAPAVTDSIWAGSACALLAAAPQALSNIIWAVASLELQPSAEWMRAWGEAVQQGLHSQQKLQWNSADLANVAWALGKFGSAAELRSMLPPLPLRLAVMHASWAVVTAADPRELVSMAWGLTVAGVAFSKTFTVRLLAAVAAKRVHFKAREWSQLLMVLAKQGVTPPQAWQRGCHAVMASRLRFMTALDFATCMWGIAQLGVEPRRAWKERFFAESYGQLFFLSPSNCCALVWALGRLRWRPPLEWQDRLFLETYTKLAGFTAAELTGTLHGLAALRLQPPVQWMHQAAAAVALAAPELGAQEVTTCLWALSRLRYRPPEPWLAALADRAAALLPEAWKLEMQQQQQGQQTAIAQQHALQEFVSAGATGDFAEGNSEAGREQQVSKAEAVHMSRVQQRQDRQEAQLRRRRQSILQQLKQLQHKHQQLLEKQRRSEPTACSLQQQQMWGQQVQGQELKLLQLRGDLEFLDQKAKAAHTKALLQQQQRGASAAPAINPFDMSGSASDSDDAQSQQQQMQQQASSRSIGRNVRRLGYHDISIVLRTLSQLQYTLDRNHGMLLAANMLGLSVTGNTWQRTATSPARLGSKGVTRGLILADTAFKARRSSGQRDDGSGRSSARAAANSTVCQSAANADDDDIFTPGADAGGVDWQLSEDSSGVVQLHSRVVSDKLLVAPSHALVRRRRHGRRYTTD